MNVTFDLCFSFPKMFPYKYILRQNAFIIKLCFSCNFPFFRKRKMSGFGHRVYKNYDPRAKVIKKLAEEVFSIVGRDPLIEVISYSLS